MISLKVRQHLTFFLPQLVDFFLITFARFYIGTPINGLYSVYFEVFVRWYRCIYTLAHRLLSYKQELKTYYYDQEISIWISHSWRVLEL